MVRFVRVAHYRITWLAAALLLSCSRTESPRHDSSTTQADAALERSERALAQVRASLSAIPGRDRVFRATRDFVILRQVELSDDPMDRETRRNLAEARSRAQQVLLRISPVIPLLRVLQEDLLDLRGALYQMARVPGLDPAAVTELGRCRARLGDLVGDLEIAIAVFGEPSSFFAADDEYYDPDFEEVLAAVEHALAQG